MSFDWTEETRITHPGMYDQSEPSSEQFTSFTLDTSFSRVVIPVDNASGKYAPSDLVRINYPIFRYEGADWLEQFSEPVPILSCTASNITIPFFSLTVFHGAVGTTMSCTEIASGMYTPANRKKFVQRVAKVRLPYEEVISATQKIRYIDISEGLPKLLSADKITLGGAPTDTLSNATVPTLEEYKSQIGTNTLWRAIPERLMPYMGIIWKKVGNYTDYA